MLLSLPLTLARAVGAHFYTSAGGKECQHPGYCHRRWSQHSPAIATNCHNTGESGRKQNKVISPLGSSLLNPVSLLTWSFISVYILLVLLAVLIISSQQCLLCPLCFLWFSVIVPGTHLLGGICFPLRFYMDSHCSWTRTEIPVNFVKVGGLTRWLDH